MSRRKVDYSGPDFYPTPYWATQALLDHEKFKESILEPACGDGAITKILYKNGYKDILATDLYDHIGLERLCRYTNMESLFYTRDFLTDDFDTVPSIITNPPYKLAEEFTLRCLELCTDKFALLLKLSFLESVTRYNSIFTKFPPSRVWVFSERLTMYPKGAKVNGGGTLAYGWFIWDKHDDGVTTTLHWIPPGYKNGKHEIS